MDQTNSAVNSIGIYVRESRDENEENYDTIETQKNLLIDYVERNNLGAVKRIYIDDNVSGSSFERDGISDLKHDVEKREIDMLMLKDLSRLGRNNAKTLLFLDYLEENDIRVVTLDGKYDSKKDNDTVGIETWFNERYISDISKKIRASLRYKIKKGEYLGHAPFGYDKSDAKKNRLCINEENAGVIREIYSLYHEGYGYAYISMLLNNKGYSSPSRGKWNASTVRRILTNRVYIGDTVQGISEKISYKSKKTRRLPYDRWVITMNTHDPIIGREEYEEVQLIRESRQVSLGPHRGDLHLFRGIMFCGNCGSVMFARKRKNRPMGYICGNYAKKGRSACTSHFINEDYLKSILTAELGTILSNREVLSKAGCKFKSCNTDEYGNNNTLKKLETRLDARIKQQNILYRDRLDGNVNKELFLRMNRELENSLKYLRKEIEKLTKMKQQIYNFDEVVKGLIEYLKENGPSKEMIREFVERITVYDKSDTGKGLSIKSLFEESSSCEAAAKVVVIDFKQSCGG